MLKIPQARLQQYMNQELPDVQAGFRRGWGTGAHIANTLRIMETANRFQKNIYFCFIDYTKYFDCVNHNKLWKILKELGVPDHFTYLLKNLYVGQEGTVRTRYGTTDWSKIGKGVWHGCIVSLCLFNFCEGYIKWNAGLDDSQARIKTNGRNQQPQIHRWYHSKGEAKWKLRNNCTPSYWALLVWTPKLSSELHSPCSLTYSLYSEFSGEIKHNSKK